MKNIEFDANLSFNSAIGVIGLYARGNKIVCVEMLGEKNAGPSGDGPVLADSGKSAVLTEAKKQIQAYLAGKLKVLDFPVEYHGTDFQQAVWRQIDKIKFGRTLTYGEIAAKIGNPAAVRAVGGAVGSNPVPIRIGCHRVLGSSGTITGFSGGDGIPTKRLLLELESIEAKG
jgi:methylated-DNA-[protein]-cysteine S-methyltransferase